MKGLRSRGVLPSHSVPPPLLLTRPHHTHSLALRNPGPQSEVPSALGSRSPVSLARPLLSSPRIAGRVGQGLGGGKGRMGEGEPAFY